jgi:YD repeat-containing protein
MMAGAPGVTLDRNNGLADDEDKIEMTLAEMPAPVREAVLKLTPEANITQLSRETENGQAVYEVEYTAYGRATEAEFNAQGALLAKAMTKTTRMMMTMKATMIDHRC